MTWASNVWRACAAVWRCALGGETPAGLETRKAPPCPAPVGTTDDEAWDEMAVW